MVREMDDENPKCHEEMHILQLETTQMEQYSSMWAHEGEHETIKGRNQRNHPQNWWKYDPK